MIFVLLKIIFQFSLVFAASESLLGDGPAEIYKMTHPPQFLYMWSGPEKLKWLASGLATNKFANLSRPQIPNYEILRRWPQSYALLKRGAIFTWTDPIGGTQGGTSETYGAFLIKIEIDLKKARAVTLVEYENSLQSSVRESFPFDEFNMIIRLGPISEVIIDPRLILNITADPIVLHDELDSALNRFLALTPFARSQHFHVSDRVRGIGSFDVKYTELLIRQFLKTNRNQIPRSLLREMNYEPLYSWRPTHKPIDSHTLAVWILRYLYDRLASLNQPDISRAFKEMILDTEEFLLFNLFSPIPYGDLQKLRAQILAEPVQESFGRGEFTSRLFRLATYYSNSVGPDIRGKLSQIGDHYILGAWLKSAISRDNIFSQFYGGLSDPFTDLSHCSKALTQVRGDSTYR